MKKVLGFSAATTLDITQSLYEKKLLTYPRTDSNYITDDMAAKLEGLVGKLRGFDEESVDELLLTGLNIDSRVINNAKVSDHHAIIPTENIDNAEKCELTSDEKSILEMVMKRFLAMLSPQYEYNETQYIFTINGNTFRCKTKETVKLGWRKFYTEKDEDEDSVNVSFSQGETFEAKNLTISECETKPPKHFTESTLLKAMENIDRRIEDKELGSYVSERGLGTPATRAVIIEKIISVGYIERKSKQLIAADKGNKFIDLLPEQVKNIEMTATMEQQLSEIEKGEITPDEVVGKVINNIKSIIEFEAGNKHTSLAPPKISLGKCPKCGGNVYQFSKDGKVIFYCEHSPKECIFRLWEDDYFWTSKGKKLGANTLKSLLAKGKIKVGGLKSEKTGKTYDANISFADRTDRNGNARIGFAMEFVNNQEKK